MNTTERQHVRGQIHAMWAAVVFGVLGIFCVLITVAAGSGPFSVVIGAGVIAACSFISVSFFRISKQEERLAADRRILARYESAIEAFVSEYRRRFWIKMDQRAKVVHDLEFWILRGVRDGIESEGKDIVMAVAIMNVIHLIDPNKEPDFEVKIKRQIREVSTWMATYFPTVPGFKARSYREYVKTLGYKYSVRPSSHN